MSQTSQEKPTGNTKIPSSHQHQNQLFRWFFTLKAEEMGLDQLLEILRKSCKEFTFSEEKSENGYHHWQGCFSLKNKEYFGTVKNLFIDTIHLEPCKKWFKAKNYCKKIETHVSGPYDENYKSIKVIEKLYPWQRDIVTTCLEEPDDRSIYWYWEAEGNKGKSALCKYMAVKFNATILCNGSFRDLAFILPDEPTIVIFDFARTNEGSVNYTLLEKLKDGILVSTKYEGKMKIFNPPHVICFANWKPDTKAVSLDRWKITELK